MSESINEEAEILAKKEQWVQVVSDLIVDQRPGIDKETAVQGVRWACLWIDDYK